jgi:hypothetical protein
MPPLPEKKTKPKRPNPSPTKVPPQNRLAEWLATGSARFTSLPADKENRSIFTANWPCWPHGEEDSGSHGLPQIQHSIVVGADKRWLLLSRGQFGGRQNPKMPPVDP